MKIHSLNCATLCPPCRRAVNGTGSYLEKGTLICHCLLLETPQDGLVLIDTGLGTEDCARPQNRLGSNFLRSSAPLLRKDETALHQVEALGFQAKDVRHILLTHLDLDHAGGLSDFPQAKVHLLATEKESAECTRGRFASERYRPEQWSHVSHWETYEATSGENWRGLPNVQRVRGLRSDVFLVPLLGHTYGHAGYAVDRGADAFLHCGDAYFHSATVRASASHSKVPWGLSFFQQLVAMDRRQMGQTQERLAKFHQEQSQQADSSVQVFCAHDPDEKSALERFLKPSVAQSG